MVKRNDYLIGYGLLILLALLVGLHHTRGQESTPDAVHPMAEGVRILPASQVNAARIDPEALAAASEPTAVEAVDWQAVAASVGVNPSAEKCSRCHFSEGEDEHPDNHLRFHAPETFGCVLCHGGNGDAESESAAHASTPASPFLRGNQMEAACGKCHLEPAVPRALYLSGGRFALHRYGCITCHALSVNIPVERYAPRLDYVADKISTRWLDEWLKEPTAYLPASKMPKVEMTDAEREAMVAFLKTLRLASPLQAINGEGDAENGRQLFAKFECQTCHTLHGEGDPIGPELERVGEKVSRHWLFAYLKNPAALTPKTKMPDYLFSDQEALDLTAFLLANAEGEASIALTHAETPDVAKIAQGFGLYIGKGCAQCHGITKYMEADVTAQLTVADIDAAIERIKAHRGEGVDVPPVAIPESDLELIAVGLLALFRSEAHKKLTYRLESGTIGDSEAFLGGFWQTPVPLQGKPPDYYNETVSQLKPENCGACHQQQWTDWQTTRHGIAMGPGIVGQIIGQSPDFVGSCLPCHAPLSEQSAYLSDADGDYQPNPYFDDELQGHGLACAVCHVRNHQRFGPPFSDKAAAASVFAEGHHGGAVASPVYQDSAFCSPCHQFDEGSTSLNGKLLENTYNEWRESPHAQNGETCQSCHMPERRHLWRGIHDHNMVKNALTLAVKLKTTGHHVEAEIRLTNVGAGHHLPTYVTPAIYVTTRLLDTTGDAIPQTERVRAIQRNVVLMPGNFSELFDTRIPAGGAWVYDYKVVRPASAVMLEVRVDVHPDRFYNDFFRDYEATRWEAQVEIDKAFQTTEESPYLLFTEYVPLGN